LTVSIIVTDQAERLFLVHFVLLNLLDLIFLFAMQDVPPELPLVALENEAVVARMEVGGDEPLEVLQMHELRVDFIQHLLVIVLLKEVLVLLPHTEEARVEELEGSETRKPADPAVLVTGLVDRQRLAVNEEDIGQEHPQRPNSAGCKSVQNNSKPS
jgi:hypothetical protein